jgi:hypothetical protein
MGRMVDANMAQHIANVELSADDAGIVQWVLSHTPTVDAVPVEEVRFHYICIGGDGVPEIKLQLGDRVLILRTDPVNIVSLEEHTKLQERYIELREQYDKLFGEFDDLRDDFVSYVCDNTNNPAPYCKNRYGSCVDGRGYCKNNDDCRGFNPTGERSIDNG